MANASTQLAQSSETQRIQPRSQLQPQVLDQAKNQSDQFSRWLLDIYDAAHTPIAEGDPPLTRRNRSARTSRLIAMSIARAVEAAIACIWRH